MKNIVLYKSKYGNTRRYATWIAEELGWELRDFSDFHKKEIGEYHTVIFGSGVYMGKMNQIKKALRMFQDKPIIFFACAGNNNDPAEIEVIRKGNFTEAQRAFHAFFYLPGGVDLSKVQGLYKIMLQVFKKVMERKKQKTPEDIAILDGFYNPTHYVDRKHIDAIVSFAREASAGKT